LFSEITEAVNDDPNNLKQIYYRVDTPIYQDQLLRQPEIDHLEDVHHFIKSYERFSYVVCFLGIVIILFSLEPRLRVKQGKRPANMHKLDLFYGLKVNLLIFSVFV